jgi:hypothetical protein
MDDEWTGLGLYRAQLGPSLLPHGIHELSDRRHYRHLISGNLLALCSVTILKQSPCFPACELPIHPATHTLSVIDGAPSHIIGPFMFRPHGGTEAVA